MWTAIIDEMVAQALTKAAPGEEVRIRILAERARNGCQRAYRTLQIICSRS